MNTSQSSIFDNRFITPAFWIALFFGPIFIYITLGDKIGCYGALVLASIMFYQVYSNEFRYRQNLKEAFAGAIYSKDKILYKVFSGSVFNAIKTFVWAGISSFLMMVFLAESGTKEALLFIVIFPCIYFLDKFMDKYYSKFVVESIRKYIKLREVSWIVAIVFGLFAAYLDVTVHEKQHVFDYQEKVAVDISRDIKEGCYIIQTVARFSKFSEWNAINISKDAESRVKEDSGQTSIIKSVAVFFVFTWVPMLFTVKLYYGSKDTSYKINESFARKSKAEINNTSESVKHVPKFLQAKYWFWGGLIFFILLNIFAQFKLVHDLDQADEREIQSIKKIKTVQELKEEKEKFKERVRKFNNSVMVLKGDEEYVLLEEDRKKLQKIVKKEVSAWSKLALNSSVNKFKSEIINMTANRAGYEKFADWYFSWFGSYGKLVNTLKGDVKDYITERYDEYVAKPSSFAAVIEKSENEGNEALSKNIIAIDNRIGRIVNEFLEKNNKKLEFEHLQSIEKELKKVDLRLEKEYGDDGFVHTMSGIERKKLILNLGAKGGQATLASFVYLKLTGQIGTTIAAKVMGQAAIQGFTKAVISKVIALSVAKTTTKLAASSAAGAKAAAACTFSGPLAPILSPLCGLAGAAITWVVVDHIIINLDEHFNRGELINKLKESEVSARDEITKQYSEQIDVDVGRMGNLFIDHYSI